MAETGSNFLGVYVHPEHGDVPVYADATKIIKELRAAVDACSARNAADVDRIKELEAELQTQISRKTKAYNEYEVMRKKNDQLRAKCEALTGLVNAVHSVDCGGVQLIGMSKNEWLERRFFALLTADSAENDNDR